MLQCIIDRKSKRDSKEQKMNLRLLIFSLIIVPVLLPAIVAGFLCSIIIASFQVGMDYSKKLALWVAEKG